MAEIQTFYAGGALGFQGSLYSSTKRRKHRVGCHVRICKRKGTRPLVYHRTAHVYVSQTFTTCTATWRGKALPRVCMCVHSTHSSTEPRPSCAPVLPPPELAGLRVDACALSIRAPVRAWLQLKPHCSSARVNWRADTHYTHACRRACSPRIGGFFFVFVF